MDFNEKLRSGYYTDTKSIIGEAPETPYSKEKEIEAEVKANFRGTYDEIMIEIARRKAEHKAIHDEYWRKARIKGAELVAEFRVDLFAEYEVTNNPKADLCYTKAWDLGHSSGLHEVASHFGELVDLIK